MKLQLWSVLLCIWWPLSLLPLSSGFSSVRQHHFNCTLLGMLAYYSSNRFIQMPVFVIFHVSSTLVVGSPASSVDVFYIVHLSVWKGFLSSIVRKQNMGHFQTQDHYKILIWNRVMLCLEQIKPNREWRVKACKRRTEITQTAKADSVIKGVCCLNITQKLSCLPWLLWCCLNKIYCRSSTELSFDS